MIFVIIIGLKSSMKPFILFYYLIKWFFYKYLDFIFVFVLLFGLRWFFYDIMLSIVLLRHFIHMRAIQIY